MIRILLRDAVRRRIKKSRAMDAPSVTAVDVQRSCEWLRAQVNDSLSQTSPHMGSDDPQVPGTQLSSRTPPKNRQRRSTAPRPRRIMRLASHSHISEYGEFLNGEHFDAVNGNQNKAGRRVQFADPRKKHVAEPAKSTRAIAESPARLLPTSEGAESLDSSSFPVVREEPVPQTDHPEEAPPLATGETLTSSPPVLRQEPPRPTTLRRKQLEAKMHRLLAKENNHMRQAEEFRAQATQHERKALALRVQIEEMGAGLVETSDGDPG
jgi:hypothetical protein